MNPQMKRIVLTHAVVLLLSMAVWSQTLTLSDDTISVSGSAEKYEIVANGFIYNTTNDTVEARWHRVVEEIPSGWGGTAICDNIQCYVPSISASPTSFFIPGNGQSRFDLHFYPEDVPGNGTVQVRAWVVRDSASTVVTGTFKANAQEPVGVDQAHENDNIRIYPNPARDYVLIKNLPGGQRVTVEVFNIFGRKMLSFSQSVTNNASAAQKFDLTSLVRGIYMIRIFDNAGNVIFTKSLSKD